VGGGGGFWCVLRCFRGADWDGGMVKRAISLGWVTAYILLAGGLAENGI